MPRPLIVTDDPDLLDDLLRLAAVSGTEVDVAADLGAARAGWADAPLLLLDERVAVPWRPPRRHQLVLVARDADDPGVWRRAVELGAGQVVHLPADEGEVVELLAGLAAGPVLGRVVGVVGGRGGAGASTLAAGLAVVAARGGTRVVLVDGDPLGGGLDLLLGAEGVPGLRWADLTGATGRLAPGALDAALPAPSGVELVSHGRGPSAPVPPPAWDALLDATTRSHHLTVVDLARGQLDEPGTAAALARCAGVLLVVPADVRGVAASVQVLGRVAAGVAEVHLVVRGPAPGGLGAREVARALGRPVCAELRGETGLASAAERGAAPGARGRGALVRCCETVLVELGLAGPAAA